MGFSTQLGGTRGSKKTKGGAFTGGKKNWEIIFFKFREKKFGFKLAKVLKGGFKHRDYLARSEQKTETEKIFWDFLFLFMSCFNKFLLLLNTNRLMGY